MTDQEIEFLKQTVIKIEIGLSLLRDGKEIPAHAKLQGVRDNMIRFINQQKENSENNND